MGVERSNCFPFLSKYVLVEETDTPSYGRAAVYRKKEIGYDYLAVLNRVVPVELAPQIQAEVAFIASQGVKGPFLRVHGVSRSSNHDPQMVQASRNIAQSNGGSGQCMQSLKRHQPISVCMQYLTYTLCQHLHFLKRSQRELSPQEYILVMRTVISAAVESLEWKLNYLDLQIMCKKLFVTPQGDVRIVPFSCSYFKEQEEESDCLKVQNPCTSVSKTTVVMHGNRTKERGRAQKKLLKQIKVLSADLLSSILSTMGYLVRMARSNVVGSGVLSESERDCLIGIHEGISRAQTLREAESVMEDMDESPLYVGDFQSTPTSQSSPQAQKKQLIPLSHHEAAHSLSQTEQSLVYSTSSLNANSRRNSQAYSSSHYVKARNDYVIN